MRRGFLVLLLVNFISILAGQTPNGNGAPFAISITTDKPSVRVGEPVIIHVALRNVSQGQLTLPETRHEGNHGELNYRVSVLGPDGNPPADTETGRRFKNGGGPSSGSIIIKYLKPGDEVTEDLDLATLAKIENLGDYTVQVERSDRLNSGLHVKSNKLVVHVTE